jgi:RNA polymerase sigma-70 factor (ECF subfamily)
LVLLERARAGDRLALDRLCARYLPRLKRWASGRLPLALRGSVDTDDLVQDTILRTIRRVEAFEPRHEGALQAYMRQVLQNRIREQIRRAGRRPEQASLDEESPDGAPSPLDQAVGREGVERYEAALLRLRPSDRELIILRIELGCDYDEVAQATDRPNAHAARMAVARALTRLALEITHAG